MNILNLLFVFFFVHLFYKFGKICFSVFRSHLEIVRLIYILYISHHWTPCFLYFAVLKRFVVEKWNQLAFVHTAYAMKQDF